MNNGDWATANGYSFTTRSPDQLGAKLVDARRSCPQDPTEVRICHIPHWIAPLGMIPGVKGLKTELEAHFLGNLEILEQAGVPVVRAGQPQNAAPGSAKKPCGRLSERRCVKPLVNGFNQPGFSHQISPVRTEGVIQSSDVRRRDSHGESFLEGGDRIYLPTADHHISRLVRAAQEFLRSE